MTDYYIPDHVHFAVENDAAVFMDIKSDQYSMLVGAEARAFTALLSRTPDSIQRVIRPECSDSDSTARAIQQKVLTDLLANGLLTTDSTAARSSMDALIALPQHCILDLEPDLPEATQAYDLWHFVVSCLLARSRLAFVSMENIISAVRRRRLLQQNAHDLGLSEAGRLVRIYNRLRPLFPYDYWCLFESLSLLEFLSRYNCFPQWVFAVQLEPWSAHCWVQHESVAFNQDVHEARTYLPLISI